MLKLSTENYENNISTPEYHLCYTCFFRNTKFSVHNKRCFTCIFSDKIINRYPNYKLDLRLTNTKIDDYILEQQILDSYY